MTYIMSTLPCTKHALGCDFEYANLQAITTIRFLWSIYREYCNVLTVLSWNLWSDWWLFFYNDSHFLKFSEPNQYQLNTSSFCFLGLSKIVLSTYSALEHSKPFMYCVVLWMGAIVLIALGTQFYTLNKGWVCSLMCCTQSVRIVLRNISQEPVS
jgi:hypothetical protein